MMVLESGRTQITFDIEGNLRAPTGGVLQSIQVKVTIEPTTAGALIYGKANTGNIAYAQVGGGETTLDLPFVEPHVWIKKLGNPTKLQVHTMGWRDDRSV
jgi:hypothetical protein